MSLGLSRVWTIPVAGDVIVTDDGEANLSFCTFMVILCVNVFITFNSYVSISSIVAFSAWVLNTIGWSEMIFPAGKLGSFNIIRFAGWSVKTLPPCDVSVNWAVCEELLIIYLSCTVEISESHDMKIKDDMRSNMSFCIG